MSDSTPGAGWWVASDGNWYPPDQAPAVAGAAVQTVPTGAAAPQGPGWWQAGDGRWYPPGPGSPTGVDPGRTPLHKRVWFWLLVVVGIGFAGCVTTVGIAGVAVDHFAHQKHTITYSVTGTTPGAAVEYTTLQEGQGQNGDVRIAATPLPWSVTTVSSGLITIYHVRATAGPGGGTVTCSITDNGVVVARHTTSGALQSTSCTWGG